MQQLMPQLEITIKMEVGRYHTFFGENKHLNKERPSMSSEEEVKKIGDQSKHSKPIRDLEDSTPRLHQFYQDLH